MTLGISWGFIVRVFWKKSDAMNTFGKYEVIREITNKVIASRIIPAHIQKPNHQYNRIKSPVINTTNDINGIIKSSSIVKKILNYACDHATIGSKPIDIDHMVY